MENLVDVSKLVMLLFYVLANVPAITAYYCDHDLCEDDQYCCGDNLCCEYVYSLWYFWVGVVFLILVLSACGGFFRYCYDSNSYVVLHTCHNDFYPSKNMDEEKNLTCATDVEAPPPYPGNQYVNTMPVDYQRFSSSSYEHSSHHPNSSRPSCR